MQSLAVGGVQPGVASTASNTPSPKLVTAAHEFEAQLMKELLKPMTSSDGLTGSEDEGSSLGSGGALGDFASEALGKALSAQGGFGIAKRILSDLSHNAGNAGAAQTPAANLRMSSH